MTRQQKSLSGAAAVMTVRGPVPVDRLGITLVHEHIMVDGPVWFNEPDESARHLRDVPVDKSLYEELRVNPYANRDNVFMLDEEIAIDELSIFRDLGGGTAVDVSCRGIGPFPEKLRRVSEGSGVNIIMGTGYYYEKSHPPEVKKMSISQLVDQMVEDITVGVDGTGIKAGIIGEVGVSWDFTHDEIKCLRAAVQASLRTNVPLTIHQPSFYRLANRVLDIVEEEGGDFEHTIIDHMCASGRDFDYQRSVLDRGVFIEYDLIGSDLYYPSIGTGQPGDDENAANIKRLIDAGYLHQLLLSHDIFIKICLKHYGGRGYGHILKIFVPMLREVGVTDLQIHTMLVENPKRLFTYPTGKTTMRRRNGSFRPECSSFERQGVGDEDPGPESQYLGAGNAKNRKCGEEGCQKGCRTRGGTDRARSGSPGVVSR
jgi:phosphotriesterase-related protein